MGADPPAPSKHGVHGLEYLVRVPDKGAAEVSGPAAALIRPTLIWFICGTCLDAAVHEEFDAPDGQPVVVLQVAILFHLVEECAGPDMQLPRVVGGHEYGNIGDGHGTVTNTSDANGCIGGRSAFKAPDAVFRLSVQPSVCGSSNLAARWDLHINGDTSQLKSERVDNDIVTAAPQHDGMHGRGQVEFLDGREAPLFEIVLLPVGSCCDPRAWLCLGSPLAEETHHLIYTGSLVHGDVKLTQAGKDHVCVRVVKGWEHRLVWLVDNTGIRSNTVVQPVQAIGQSPYAAAMDSQRLAVLSRLL
ncbi:hypothetical protein HG530_014829 [Fusarium avenaceum]|nr:hypothetical protein HG530_014829 [Fusarium avenaceum]